MPDFAGGMSPMLSGMFGGKKGIPPWMMLSPMGGLMATRPEIGLPMMSPLGGGLAHLFGAFK